ncbi:MAG: sensor histidine kinase [Kribbellaceae bacterium]
MTTGPTSRAAMSGTGPAGYHEPTVWRRTATAALRGLVALLRGMALFSPKVVLAFVMLASISLVMTAGFWILLVPVVAAAVRGLANLNRRLARSWSGVDIPEPYLPPPTPGTRPATGWRRWRLMRALTDPATWRDMLWALVDPVVGGVLALAPAATVMLGLYGTHLPLHWLGLAGFHHSDGTGWYTFVPVTGAATAWLAAVLGVGYIALGLAMAPRMLRLHGRWTRVLLAPTANATLALRVRQLAESRSDAVDTQAAELRRIERDLHDGAQARLVAMGMNLGAAERLVEENPAAAKALLAEMREASAKALNELRDLVRGIHPPVLADRGLGDAVRALALDCPLQEEVTADLPGRLALPVESAAYFAVSEVLANAVKHADALRVWIDLRYEGGRLRMSVTDDGHGGADPARGTGLRGVERRLATFDGVLALNSPPGGPTMVMMELPCALSSPRTSSYSETA